MWEKDTNFNFHDLRRPCGLEICDNKYNLILFLKIPSSHLNNYVIEMLNKYYNNKKKSMFLWKLCNSMTHKAVLVLWWAQILKINLKIENSSVLLVGICLYQNLNSTNALYVFLDQGVGKIVMYFAYSFLNIVQKIYNVLTDENIS